MTEYFCDNIDSLTLKNKNYRKVIYTEKDSFQLVLMSLVPREEIGMETHDNHTQFIHIVKGRGVAVLYSIKNKAYEARKLTKGAVVVIPRGIEHNIINTSNERLQLYTIYTPPEHKPRTVQKTKKK